MHGAIDNFASAKTATLIGAGNVGSQLAEHLWRHADHSANRHRRSGRLHGGESGGAADHPARVGVAKATALRTPIVCDSR